MQRTLWFVLIGLLVLAVIVIAWQMRARRHPTVAEEAKQVSPKAKQMERYLQPLTPGTGQPSQQQQPTPQQGATPGAL